MRMHRDASYSIPDSTCEDSSLLAAARESWNEAVAAGELYGYRNAQATVLAPTGTISFLMDCDTTGIEPDFSLVKYKELVGGGSMVIANRTVPMALRTLGYATRRSSRSRRTSPSTARSSARPGLKAEHLEVFDVAVGERAISHPGHIKMMGAVQPFLSGAISKTVNLPETATVDDIAEAYIQAWKLGVKALAIYRDGSKTAQALRTDAQKERREIPRPRWRPARAATSRPRATSSSRGAVAGARRSRSRTAPTTRTRSGRMPRERQSLTHKFSLGGHEGYITAGMYDGRDGRGDLPDRHRQGGLDPPRHDELVRDRDLDLAAVRRAARDARAQVRLHALRAGRDHHQPGDPVREVDARLHHALARVAWVPGLSWTRRSGITLDGYLARHPVRQIRAACARRPGHRVRLM
jgi:ribonucleoside-diphosphate reductase alpha chain